VSSRQVRGQDQGADQQRGDRVGPGEAGDRDHDAGHDHGRRTERVGGDLKERALMFRSLRLAPPQHQEAGRVGRQGRDAKADQQRRLDRGRRGTSRLIASATMNTDMANSTTAFATAARNLRPGRSRTCASGSAAGSANTTRQSQRQPDPGHVGRHVSGVGEQHQGPA